MWLFYAVLSTTLWALTNPTDAALRRHFIKNDFDLAWFLTFFRLPVALILLVIFRNSIAWDVNTALMLLAGFLWTLPIAFYYRAVEFEEVSRVVIFMQLLPVFTLIIAGIFIGERLEWYQFFAFFLILFGGIFAAIRKIEGVWHFSKAFGLLVLAALCWAASDVMFKAFEIGFLSFWSAFSVYFLGSSLFSLVLLFSPKRVSRVFSNFKNLPSRGWMLLVFANTAGISGSLFFAYALTLGKASLTTVIVGIQPLLAFVFAYLLGRIFPEIPRESVDRKSITFKLFSLFLVVLGLIYLSFGG